MPDFSVILQSPAIRSLVQDNLLERAFHDALFPRLLFREEAIPVLWPAGVGDVQVFSAPGLMSPRLQPLRPGQDPLPNTYTTEQWTAQLQQYADSIDTHMPTSMVAIVNLFQRNAHQLGLGAGMALNRLVRNRLYAAALSGNSVIDVASSTTSVHVVRLNGFTRARNPNLAAGSPIKFDYVSSSNPLAVRIFDNGAEASFNVIGYVPDNAGDEYGPGTLTLNTAVTSVLARAYIYALDASQITRSGGGLKVDSITSTSLPTLADVRAAVGNMQQQNVPTHPDGRFHAHIDAISQAKVFQDTELQRLNTALPDYYAYKQFALGEILNTVFIRNTECPLPETVVNGTTATYTLDDPFPGELYSTGANTGTRVHRILFTAYGGCMEYYSDTSELITEAGINGKVGEPTITNNGIEINTDRVTLIVRAPLNRLQDTVSTSWKFIGDWPVRTDAAAGNASRYKRFAVIEHGE